MRLLALDTSSAACTAGAMNGEAIATRYEEQPRAHTKILVPMIRTVLEEADLAVAELDAVVLGNGPGSFIGMRIGASVAQGIAFAAGIDIVPVSSLATVAAAAGDAGEVVAVAQDARMQQVYVGLYRIDAAGLPQPVIRERLQDCSAIAEIAANAPVVLAGAGWRRYPALEAANREAVGRDGKLLYPRAAALLTLGQAAFAAGLGVAPAEVEPAYLRQQVARPPADTSP
jgi:tRNA threonylcarbamoyladenosine biosynthesis protein TsaB